MTMPYDILKDAIKAVPAVKYALGVAGVISAVAIVAAFRLDPGVAVLGTVLMLVLMTVLVVFAKLSALKASALFRPAMALTWFSLILLMATSTVMFTSVFFRWPLDLSSWLSASANVSPAGPASMLDPRLDDPVPIQTLDAQGEFYMEPVSLGGDARWSGGNSIMSDGQRHFAGIEPALLTSGAIGTEIYDFEARFRVTITDQESISWVLRAQDTQNYYKFSLSLPDEDRPGVLRSEVYREGTSAGSGCDEVEVFTGRLQWPISEGHVLEVTAEGVENRFSHDFNLIRVLSASEVVRLREQGLGDPRDLEHPGVDGMRPVNCVLIDNPYALGRIGFLGESQSALAVDQLQVGGRGRVGEDD